MQASRPCGPTYYINLEHMATRVALFIILLLYPVSHLYAYHSAVGHLSRSLDGLYGVMAIVAVLILAPLFMLKGVQCLNGSKVFTSLMFIVFVVTSFAWVFVHFHLAGGVIGGSDLFLYYARILLDYTLLFLVGFYLRLDQWRLPFILAFILIFLNALVFTNWDRMMIDLRYVVDPQFRGIYLGLSTTALFTGLFVWAVVKRPLIRLLVLCSIIPVLFLTGSRADLGAFLLVLPVALWLTLPPARQLLVYVLGVTLLMLGAIIIGPETLMASRHAQILSPEQMTSLIARNELLSWGVERIYASPIFGDYGGVLAQRGTLGGYIHNLTSVWQAFGLFPFLLYSGLLFIGAWSAARLMFRYSRGLDRHAQLVVVLILLVTIQVLIAKSLGWAHVALAWGLLMGLTRRKYKEACPT